MNDKMISIVIPVYNSDLFFEECLKSIYSQNNVLFEVIVIDDGSTDKTKTICKKWEKANENFKYIFQRNKGPSAARNRGIAEASGELLYFMDADDSIDPYFLFSLAKNIDSYDICVGNYIIHRDDECDYYISDSQKVDYCNRTMVINEVLSPKFNSFSGFIWNKLFRSAFIKYNVKFDESVFFGEDMQFLINCVIKNATITCSKDRSNFYNYYVRNNSLSTTKVSKEKQSILSAFDSIEMNLRKNNLTYTTIDVLRLETMTRLYKNMVLNASNKKVLNRVKKRMNNLSYRLLFNKHLSRKSKLVFCLIKFRLSWIIEYWLVYIVRV